jgi:hypothetical protein
MPAVVPWLPAKCRGRADGPRRRAKHCAGLRAQPSLTDRFKLRQTAHGETASSQETPYTKCQSRDRLQLSRERRAQPNGGHATTALLPLVHSTRRGVVPAGAPQGTGSNSPERAPSKWQMFRPGMAPPCPVLADW